MKIIILDTNTLMAISQFKIDLFSELDRLCDFSYKVVILDKTVDELKGIISEQAGKYKLQAKLALDILDKKGVRKIDTEAGKVDDLLVKMAEEGKIVVTQDKELKRRIKEKGAEVLTIRQKKMIVWG
ncbi:MAG: PIN domain-containing protein [Candidatus Woesearchaeota archaeon]